MTDVSSVGMRKLGLVAVLCLVACGEDREPAPSVVAAPTAAASATPQIPAESPPPEATGEGGTESSEKDQSLRGPSPQSGGRAPDGYGGDHGVEGRGGGSKIGGKATKLAAVAELSEGTLDRSEVESAIDASVGRFMPCLQAESRVRVRATISKNGDVVDAAVLSADPDEPKLRDCVAAVFRKVPFPRPKGGDATTFTIDLALRPDMRL